MGGDSGGRLHAFRSLAGNRALVRVLAGYALFVLTEYSAWIAMLVFAYGHGGTTVAGIVAAAQLVPGAMLAYATSGFWPDSSGHHGHRRGYRATNLGASLERSWRRRARPDIPPADHG